MPLRPPPPVSSNPLRADRLRAAGRARARRAVPARLDALLDARARAPFSAQPAADAARGLRALRPGLHAADPARATSCSCSARRRTTTCSSRTPRTSAGATGDFGDLIPLLGDGLLTIDGDFHRRSRRIMLPAFHRERIGGRGATMDEEIDARARRLARGRRARPLRLDARAGAARSRCARCSAWIPTTRRATSTPPREFEEALAFYVARLPAAGPARARHAVGAHAARARAARRADLRGDRPPPRDRASAARTSSACCSTRATRTANPLKRPQIRDEVMTLLFAGHDTTTSTVSFMFYELARHPERRALRERRRARGRGPTARSWRALRARDGARRDAAQVPARLGRPAARGRAVRVRRPHGARPACRSTTARGPATTCPTCSPEPERVRPERFTPEAKARDAEGRLRAVRRRLAHVHRDALRPAGDPHDRRADPRALRARAAPRLRARRSARCRRSARRTACRCSCAPRVSLSPGARVAA